MSVTTNLLVTTAGGAVAAVVALIIQLAYQRHAKRKRWYREVNRIAQRMKDPRAGKREEVKYRHDAHRLVHDSIARRLEKQIISVPPTVDEEVIGTMEDAIYSIYLHEAKFEETDMMTRFSKEGTVANYGIELESKVENYL